MSLLRWSVHVMLIATGFKIGSCGWRSGLGRRSLVGTQRPAMVTNPNLLELLTGSFKRGNSMDANWQRRNDNFVLAPMFEAAPVGVIHFLGGGFVGAAPHITYKYLLEALSRKGYVIVATPYQTKFDYITTCDGILQSFDSTARELAKEFGALPVIGMGHSLGALLQTLISSLFPTTARAGNVLISFNNKPATEAIPAFTELVVPFAVRAMGNQTESTRVRNQIASLRELADRVLAGASSASLLPVMVRLGLLPVLTDGLALIDQVPAVLQAIKDGDREFTPSPADAREACRRMYRARHTLVLRFAGDGIDESPAIAQTLREANTIMRMKRPLVEMNVELRELAGTHITPLTPDLAVLDLSLLSPVGVPDSLNPARMQAVRELQRGVDATIAEIAQFLDANIARLGSAGSQPATTI